MNNDQPTYYAIIPASVRYDNALPMGAKMMYGEITALSNAKGYCFASNGYFAKLYDVTNQAISKWIKQLEQAGHVRIEYVGEQGNQQRRVSIAVATYQQELIGVSTTVEGVSTVVEHNNINSNSTREHKHTTPREEKPTTDWKQVARQMTAHAHGEGKEDWQYMAAMFNYTGHPQEVMSEWACKATPYQLQTWRDHFPKLLPWVKRAAQSKARNTYKAPSEETPAIGRIHRAKNRTA